MVELHSTVNVLVVEDEALLASVVFEALTDGGFATAVVSNADEAIALLDKEPDRFAAVVTDIDVPGEADGWALARRAREQKAEIAIIYMSGKAGGDWASAGVPDSVFLQKPFALAQLVAAVANQLNKVG